MIRNVVWNLYYVSNPVRAVTVLSECFSSLDMTLTQTNEKTNKQAQKHKQQWKFVFFSVPRVNLWQSLNIHMPYLFILFLEPLRLEEWKLGHLTLTPATQRIPTSPGGQGHSQQTRRARSSVLPLGPRALQLKASSLSMSTSKRPLCFRLLRLSFSLLSCKQRHFVVGIFHFVHCIVLFFILQGSECNKLQHPVICNGVLIILQQSRIDWLGLGCLCESCCFHCTHNNFGKVVTEGYKYDIGF